jgi:hypothetical protein
MSLRSLFLAGTLALGFASTAHADDAFLEKPIVFATYPPDGPRLPSYSDHVNRLSQSIGKRIVLPEGAMAFADDVSKWKVGTGFCTWGGLGPENFATARQLLDRDCKTLGMKWHYDAASDSIAFDFAWRKDVPMPQLELRAALLNPAVLSGSSFDVGAFHYAITNPDALPAATLDALISKPENFPKAWPIRFAEDIRRSVLNTPSDNLFTGKIEDQGGHEHLLVLNERPFPMNPGEGTMTYYVFDAMGRFEQGGVMSGGWRCHDASAWTEAKNTRLTVRVFFNYRDKFDQHFILTEKGLVVEEVVGTDGKPLIDYTGIDLGATALHVTN